MKRLGKTAYGVLLFLAVLGPVYAAGGTMPVVYQDDYVVIRSGVKEIGHEPVHLGNTLSLVVEAVFNGDRVRLEALDGQLFRRNWSDDKAIALYRPPEVTKSTNAGGATVLRAVYRFQILGCPKGKPACPGPKVYQLPDFPVGYEIVDQAGNVQNKKSARFRPWPGILPVTNALPVAAGGEVGDFNNYFPDGGFPRALDVEDRGSAGLGLATAGILVFVGGFGFLSRRKAAPHRFAATAGGQRRWEKALAALHDAGLPDQEWADLLRRCAVWYSLDELGFNPCAWLNEGAAARPGNGEDVFRTFFYDVLEREGIAPAERDDFLRRFREMAGMTATENRS